MNEEEYIATRVDDQVSYYNGQSKKGQSTYKLLSSLQIISGATIPVIAGFSKEICYSEWITAVLGLIVTCATAFLALNKYQERWINFRTTCENLLHVKHIFITSSHPYNDDDRFNRFVHDIEAIISKENSDWSGYMTSEKKDSK